MSRTLADLNGIVTFEVAIAQADKHRKQERKSLAEVWEYLAVMTMQLKSAQAKIETLERNPRGI